LLRSEPDLAAHTSINGILLFFYFIPKGFAECIISKLGRIMGEGDHSKAKY